MLGDNRIMKSNVKPNLSKANVLVVGDAMLDRYWYGAVDRISPEAPVPVVKINRREDRVGGAANVAYNAAMLGAQTSFLSVVGDDAAGRELEDLMRRTGITTYLTRDSQLETTVKLRVIGRAQQLIRLDFENTPEHDVLAAQTGAFKRLVTEHDAILFSDYAKGGLAHVSEMIAIARAAKKPVLIDPKGSNYVHYHGATVITPNRSELQQVIGSWRDEDELRVKAQNLRESLKLETLLFTRSEDGMSLYDAEGDLHVRATAHEVFDVTGAGDTVIATLAALVASGMSLREAMPHANRAGGIVVGKFGTATVSFEELFQ
jgi:rfaE bifunctional protein kinase chain/domain